MTERDTAAIFTLNRLADLLAELDPGPAPIAVVRRDAVLVRRRRRFVASAVTAAAGGACLVGAIAAFGPRTSDSSPSGPSEHGRKGEGAPIVIDASVGETFTPVSTAGATGSQLLTPLAAYRTADHGSLPPSDSSTLLGYLTLPLGAGSPDGYTARHQLVYAYTWSQCQPATGPFRTDSATEPSSRSQCTAWMFVDATTGAMVDETWTN